MAWESRAEPWDAACTTTPARPRDHCTHMGQSCGVQSTPPYTEGSSPSQGSWLPAATPAVLATRPPTVAWGTHVPAITRAGPPPILLETPFLETLSFRDTLPQVEQLPHSKARQPLQPSLLPPSLPRKDNPREPAHMAHTHVIALTCLSRADSGEVKQSPKARNSWDGRQGARRAGGPGKLAPVAESTDGGASNTPGPPHGDAGEQPGHAAALTQAQGGCEKLGPENRGPPANNRAHCKHEPQHHSRLSAKKAASKPA